jgi:hypothetical protein
MVAERNAYMILVAKLEVKVRRPRRKWKENIKTDLTETGRAVVYRNELTRDRVQRRVLVNTLMNVRGLWRGIS